MAPPIIAPGPLGTRKANALRSEVLPDPEGPINAKRLPPLVSPDKLSRITLVSSVPSFFFLVTLYVISRHCNTTPWSVGRMSPIAAFDIVRAAPCSTGVKRVAFSFCPPRSAASRGGLT